MTTKSFIESPMGLQIVEVEVKLMAGLPILHVLGQPDTHIKECGIRIKSALRSCGFVWPKGRQIVVNLRPTYLRKHSRGLDLSIVAGILAESGQAPWEFIELAKNKIFYGEVGLSGEVFAPEGLSDVIFPDSELEIVTGPLENDFVEGKWWSAKSIRDLFESRSNSRSVNWSEIWQRPELPPYDFNSQGAELLKVSALMGASTLLTGPQGSGKSTFARAVYALSTEPIPKQFRENLKITGVESKWRALETPHHTTPAKAMVGGGTPLVPGVISKAHGGVLIMDEFLEFDSEVREALREPLETGAIHLNRVGDRAILPAKFQLIATTNLCPCGKRAPGMGKACNYTIHRCKSTFQKFSGPLLDRFDLVGFSHEWMKGPRQSLPEILAQLERAREFQQTRAFDESVWPDSVRDFPVTFRRKKALMKTARALADLDESELIREIHFGRAKFLSCHPIDTLQALYA